MRKSKYNSNPLTLGEKILKHRLDSGKTLLEVAITAGISESYMSRIESDKQIPSLNCFLKISKALKFDPLEGIILIGLKALEDAGFKIEITI